MRDECHVEHLSLHKSMHTPCMHSTQGMQLQRLLAEPRTRQISAGCSCHILWYKTGVMLLLFARLFALVNITVVFQALCADDH